MSYTNPMVQCPACDFGDIGCSCCGGEGLVTLFEAEDWIEQEAARVDAMMAEDVAMVELMDHMLGLREGSEIAAAE